MVTRFLSLPELSPGAGSEPMTARVGDVLYIVDDTRLNAVDLAGPRLLWERKWPRPTPEYYRVPRRIRAYGGRVWADAHRVICLQDTEGGVAAIACDPRSGETLWTCDITTPPPVEWTEEQPAYPGAHTEEIEAALLCEPELALALVRTSRRSMQWPGPPLPPLRAQLDAYALDPNGGSVRRRCEIPDVYVPILEKRRLRRWLVTDRALLELDLAECRPRVVAETSGDPCWPRETARGIALAWRKRGGITAAIVDPATGRISEHPWKRNGVKSLTMHVVGARVALQINDQFLAPLDETMAPLWETRIKPYIYGAAAHNTGPLVVAASGGGGAIAAYASDGTPQVEERLVGGAWNPVAVAGTDAVVAICGAGLAVVRSHAKAPEVTPLPGSESLIDAGDGRVVVLCGAPAPGIHVVRVTQRGPVRSSGSH